MKWKCKLEFAENDVWTASPLHVYPQPNDQGWEITKIRIFLQRNSGEIRITIHCCHVGACKTHQNVRLHIVTKASHGRADLPAKADD
jgi:hypothetical protein